MTNDTAIRNCSEQRITRASQHLLHPTKTDEIEVLESGGIGNDDHNETKVCALLYYLHTFVYLFIHI